MGSAYGSDCYQCMLQYATFVRKLLFISSIVNNILSFKRIKLMNLSATPYIPPTRLILK